jgi:hypothetical protein
VPRLINLLFSRTLLHVYLEERHDITAEDVEMVAEDLRSVLEGLVPFVKTPAKKSGHKAT